VRFSYLGPANHRLLACARRDLPLSKPIKRAILVSKLSGIWRMSDYFVLIRSAFPRARIIPCRRHPVDTCLSIYFKSFTRLMDFAYDRSDLMALYIGNIRGSWSTGTTYC